MGIIVVHRSDGSGTTFIFANYLSKVSKEWARQGWRSDVKLIGQSASAQKAMKALPETSSQTVSFASAMSNMPMPCRTSFP